MLYVAFAGTDQRGVHRKLAEQVSALRAHGAEVEGLVFTDVGSAPLPAPPPYRLIEVTGGGFGATGRAEAMRHCLAATNTFRPDIVYMRYPIYDAHILQFVQTVPVVFELQTIFANENPPASAAVEAVWASQVLPHAAGLVGVTTEILEYERARAGRPIRGHVMPNGADPHHIPVTPLQQDGAQVHLLCVASFYPWHGVDRLIVGLASEPDVPDVHLHLVGDGPTLPALQELATHAGLTSRVHVHGPVPVSQLDAWYARAHVAIGSLAPHRVGLRELAALKHREYALRALPMVFAGRDVDFPESLPWCRQLVADDSPVSPRVLRALGLGWSNPARRRQIRAWAESHVSWDAKMPPLLRFLETCATLSTTSVKEPSCG